MRPCKRNGWNIGFYGKTEIQWLKDLRFRDTWWTELILSAWNRICLRSKTIGRSVGSSEDVGVVIMLFSESNIRSSSSIAMESIADVNLPTRHSRILMKSPRPQVSTSWWLKRRLGDAGSRDSRRWAQRGRMATIRGRCVSTSANYLILSELN